MHTSVYVCACVLARWCTWEGLYSLVPVRTECCPGEREVFQAMVAERKAKEAAKSSAVSSDKDSGDVIQVY